MWKYNTAYFIFIFIGVGGGVKMYCTAMYELLTRRRYCMRYFTRALLLVGR